MLLEIGQEEKLDSKEQAEKLRDEIVRSARRRNAEHNDVPDRDQFEHLMAVLEGVGEVTIKAAAAGAPQSIVGRALKYYAKCFEAADGSA